MQEFLTDLIVRHQKIDTSVTELCGIMVDRCNASHLGWLVLNTRGTNMDIEGLD